MMGDNFGGGNQTGEPFCPGVKAVTTTKWTRKQVFEMAARVRTGGDNAPRMVDVAHMLTDLAPPEEPRTWKVGDFLMWNGVPRYIRQQNREGVFQLVTLTPGQNDLTAWFTPGFFKDAVPLKLVEDKP